MEIQVALNQTGMFFQLQNHLQQEETESFIGGRGLNGNLSEIQL